MLKTLWAGYGAVAWAMTFAVIHLYWALGGLWGLPAGLDIRANRLLYLIDLAAIPLCLIGAGFALALIQTWGERLPRRWLLSAGWGVSGLLFIHSVPALVVGLLLATTRELTAPQRFSLYLYEPWFFLGGVLFTLATLSYQQKS